MANFEGKLNANEIFGSIYNMIIGQQVFADNISGHNDSLVNAFKVDGTLYGDTKLYYSTDAIGTQEWLGDNEAQNLLKLHRPADPDVQAITIDQFRMIPLTVDNYLSKRAYSTEGAFNEVQSVMLGWMRETKKIYDETLINEYVGTTKSNAARGTVEVDVTSATTGLSGEEKARVKAQTIAAGLGKLLFDLKDISRDFNDYGHLRSVGKDQVKVIFNSDYVNEITKMDLPTIFHKEGLFDSMENVLPARYFGDIITEDKVSDGTLRSAIEADYAKKVGGELKHLFPGDLIPAEYYVCTAITEGGSKTYRASTTKVAKTINSKILAGEAYVQNNKVICKVIYNKAVPFMSAFESATSFFNQRSLTENHYLIWGYSKPQYLLDKPFITVVEK